MHALNSELQAKTVYHTEKQGFGYLWLSKKFKTRPPKPAEVEPSFRKVSVPPAKLHMLFPAHLWVRGGHNIDKHITMTVKSQLYM